MTTAVAGCGADAGFFEGFALEFVDVGEVALRVRHGGQGSPVVLLHGHPRTHTTWHRLAPRLADSFFVVCPDLRGYGQSTPPPDAPQHAQASKRAMAEDVLALMRHLGHDQFAAVGHDRGSLVASRMAMDHPSAVMKLAVMDGLPVTPRRSGGRGWPGSFPAGLFTPATTKLRKPRANSLGRSPHFSPDRLLVLAEVREGSAG